MKTNLFTIQITTEMDLFLNECEIVYKHKQRPSERPRVTCSRDVYNLVLPHWQRLEVSESFKILMLDSRNRVKSIFDVSTGALNSTTVDARLVFGAALKALATTIILVHNHPSGEVDPSENDKRTTATMKEIGDLLNIKVVDHLIISRYAFYSFSDDSIIHVRHD